MAILAELDGPPPEPGMLWGTWCAEPPEARLTFEPAADARAIFLNGTKAWCSGAAAVTQAVVSGWNGNDDPCLAAVVLRNPSVRITD